MFKPLFTSDDDQPYERNVPHASTKNTHCVNTPQEQPVHSEDLSYSEATTTAPSADTCDLNGAHGESYASNTNQTEHISGSSDADYSYTANTQRTAPNLKVTCSVCQVYLVDRVILPCRHVCVCEICFPQMDRCPMCRGKILSTFCLGGKLTSEAYGHQDNIDDEQEDESWFIRLNNRLNNFFGFS